MNKISKKIVSLVTMAAFALTLVPAAAFAAVDGAEVNITNGATQNVVLSNAGQVSVEVNVKAGTDNSNSIILWAESENENPSADVNYTGSAAEWQQPSTGVWENTTYLTGGSYTAERTYAAKVNFSEAGVYTIHVGVQDQAQQGVNDTTALSPLVGTSTEVGTITVYNPAAGTNAGTSFDIAGSQNNTIDVNTGDTKAVKFNIKDANGASAMLNDDQALYVWATAKGQTAPVDVISVENGDDDEMAGVYELDGLLDGASKNVTFNMAGEYQLWLGYGKNAADAMSKISEVDYINVNVTDPVAKVGYITFDKEQNDGYVAQTGGTAANSAWEYNLEDEVVPNNVKTYTITGVAYEAANKVAANVDLSVSENEDDFSLVGDAADGTVTTNDQGVFTVKVKIDDPGSYDLVVASLNDQVKATLTIITDTVAPAGITTTEDGGVLLAGNDINYIDNPVSSMADAIQFSITDTYGHEQTGNGVLTKENAYDATATKHADYIDVTNAPEDSELSAADLYLAWDSEANAYTLFYMGSEPAKDLVAGEYTVEVSLNNGEKAKASFTVANFGDIEELTLDLKATNIGTNAQNNSIVELDDEVTLGSRVSVEPMYVDGNGLKIKADNISLSATGAAVANRNLTGANPSFDLFLNTPSNQSLLGTIITVQAYDETNHNYVEKELTVVDALQNETLAFDPIKGEVGESNTVNVTVVDADGNLSKVNGTMSAYIADQSNEDATIDLDVQKNVVNGAGKLFLKSDAEGTVDVVVAVKATNGEIYANTLTYTFGKEDPYAGSYIVMTIGSDQYLINGEIFDGSVDNLGAPYIDSAWRTMVPVRILAETFGATVDYTDGVVTIVDGDTTVVMTVGEDTYTVNGEEQTMDTAPVIGDGDRTYVPVRFVAEALGYNVTPMYLNGLTSAVHFSK